MILGVLRWWAEALLLTVSILTFLAIAAWLQLPVVDDAAISIAYGLSFWEGAGFRLTPASQIVEGTSTLAWSILATAPNAVGGWDPLLCAKWLGVGMGGLGVGLCALWFRAAGVRRAWLGAVVALASVLLVPSLHFWLSSGMETGLQILGIGALGLIVLSDWKKRPTLFVLVVSLVATTRPEGPLFAALVFLTESRRVRDLLWLGLPLVVLLVFRLWYFADVVPNTFYAKRDWDFGGGSYVLGFVAEYVWFVVFACVGAVVMLMESVASRRLAVLVGAVCAAGGLFLARAHGDWMREWRFVVPLVPVLGLLVAGFVTFLADSALEAFGAAKAVVVVVAVVMGVTGVLGGQSLSRFDRAKASPEFSAAFVARQSEVWSRQLSSFGVRRPVVGLPDVGGASLVFRNGEVVDVAGLADYSLAHARGRLDLMDDYLFFEVQPDVIDAHGPSGHIGSLPHLRRLYGGWNGGVAFVAGLTATEDPRCPGGRSETTLLSGPEVVAASIDRESDPVRALARWRCASRYLPTSILPDSTWRRAASERAIEKADALLVGEPETALRFLSLATVLSGGQAHLRRRTELLRAVVVVQK